MTSMINTQNIPNTINNYDEIILIKDAVENNTLYNISFDESIFDKYINIFKNNKQYNKKIINKSYRVYYNNDIEYQQMEDNIFIYKKIVNKYTIKSVNNMNYIVINYNRTNSSHNLFNWNDELNNTYDINRKSFLFDNKIYLNFEKQTNIHNKNICYKIYINFTYKKYTDAIVEILTYILNTF